MFADQQKAKCVWRYEFYESSVAVGRKIKTFYHVHYHQTPGENKILRWSQTCFFEFLRPTQYCIFSWSLKIIHIIKSFDFSTYSGRRFIKFISQHTFCFLLICKHVSTMKFARKMKFSHF
jgi:hypothetical protein